MIQTVPSARISRARTREVPVRASRLLLALFIVSLFPFSLTIDSDGVSANYVYVLIPFIMLLAGVHRRLVQREQVLRAILVYSLIYVLGFVQTVVNGVNIDAEIRRLASFWVFLFPLCLAFVEFKPIDLDTFKRAVVAVAVGWSLWQVVDFGNTTVGLFEMKGAIGGQRYGFVLCLGFFIALFSDRLLLNTRLPVERLVVCSIIIVGMGLTFSRATMVSLMAGLVFALVGRASDSVLPSSGKSAPRPAGRMWKALRLAGTVAAAGLVFALFQGYSGVDLWEFYNVRLFQPALDSTLWRATLEGDVASPEGYRSRLWGLVLNYAAYHPLAGSGYRGLYLLFDEFRDGASTHNQYADVLLRTGAIGFVLWCFLLYRIIRFCRLDKGLAVGFVAVLIYGLFHETFKLSQGSFIFGMLLSFSYVPGLATEHRTLIGRPAARPRRPFRPRAGGRPVPNDDPPFASMSIPLSSSISGTRPPR